MAGFFVGAWGRYFPGQPSVIVYVCLHRAESAHLIAIKPVKSATCTRLLFATHLVLLDSRGLHQILQWLSLTRAIFI